MNEMAIDVIRNLQADIHIRNRKWWFDEAGERLNRNKGELLMLMVSEIAEGMEGERKSLMDDKLPNRPMIEVELADTMIRILDYAAGFGYDVAGAMAEKLAFNDTRADHTYAARAQANGKKW
jgi:NTP pyrophosphatase (non-canonical NTP hydrolase)